VTFEVEEVRVLGAQASTSVGQNEALFNGGGAFRNIFGRGEYCNASYSKGTKKTSSFGVNFVKPLHDDLKTKYVSVLNTSVRQCSPYLCTSVFSIPLYVSVLHTSVGQCSPYLCRLTANIYQSYLEAGWSGFKEVDRGAALGVNFSTAPNVSHQVTAEAAWRHLTCLSKTAAFGVREHSGHSLKTALKYQLQYDSRDQHIFPTRGQLFRFQTESAGYGGSVGFSKNEVTVQANQELPFDVVAQVSLSGGHMFPLSSKGHTIADRFFMGGPMTFRGFQMGGVGPHSEKCALGAQSYWLGSAHVYAPLPLLERGPFLERFRLHGWTSMGTCGDFRRGADDSHDPAQAVRMSLGAGLALNLAGMARVELNYCVPVKHQSWDKPQPGLQFGVAADIL
ncbi:Bacterial surface antigen (D15), partial [Trinorchestia longiramus]